MQKQVVGRVIAQRAMNTGKKYAVVSFRNTDNLNHMILLPDDGFKSGDKVAITIEKL